MCLLRHYITNILPDDCICRSDSDREWDSVNNNVIVADNHNDTHSLSDPHTDTDKYNVTDSDPDSVHYTHRLTRTSKILVKNNILNSDKLYKSEFQYDYYE